MFSNLVGGLNSNIISLFLLKFEHFVRKCETDVGLLLYWWLFSVPCSRVLVKLAQRSVLTVGSVVAAVSSIAAETPVSSLTAVFAGSKIK